MYEKRRREKRKVWEDVQRFIYWLDSRGTGQRRISANKDIGGCGNLEIGGAVRCGAARRGAPQTRNSREFPHTGRCAAARAARAPVLVRATPERATRRVASMLELALERFLWGGRPVWCLGLLIWNSGMSGNYKKKNLRLNGNKINMWKEKKKNLELAEKKFEQRE